MLRGAIPMIEATMMVEAFVRLGLVGTHAILAARPLLVAALFGPILGEKVGWHRSAAIRLGLVGILVILRPGSTDLDLGRGSPSRRRCCPRSMVC